MKSILIRAEDKNVWEARTPIVPQDLKALRDSTEVSFLVEKSEKRFFKNDRYKEAGAEICEDMNPGDIILGIKEIPEQKLLDEKIYMFFSHTIKGQKANMPMLKRIIDGKSTLIDYERIVDADNRRLVYFGHYAGDAGAIDIFWLMGAYWQHKGIDTPLSSCRQALRYHSVDEAMSELKKTGLEIQQKGFPESITPIVIGILGYGNVSKGAQSIIDCLPTERIDPDKLADFIIGNQWNSNTVYVTVFKEKDLVRRRDGSAFELQDYYQHPERYESKFSEFLPNITILVNATYWDQRYPRFVTWNELRRLSSEGKLKLQGIADITCDVDGSIECNVKTTDSGMPAYLCDPETRKITDGHKGDGIVLLAVDNLPAELPNDSSTFFSNQLKQFIPGLIQTDFNKDLKDSGLPPELVPAVIVYKGNLTDRYQYLEEYL